MIAKFYVFYNEFKYHLFGEISMIDIIQVLKLLNLNYIYALDDSNLSLVRQSISSIILNKIISIEFTFMVDNWSDFLKIMKNLSIKYRVGDIFVLQMSPVFYYAMSSILIRYKCYSVKGLYKCSYLIEKILTF